MDEELKTYLVAMESRLATKADLSSMEDRLTEKMRDIETHLLSAFHDWARPVEIRLRTLPMIEERLGLLEERISKIERGEKPGGVH